MLRIRDKGPRYKETNLRGYPVEPLSTYTNLGFLAITIYWIVRIVQSNSPQHFLSVALLLLFVGWFGGTMYHATRSNDLWFYLDIGAIAVLLLGVSIYFWYLTKIYWLIGASVVLMSFIATIIVKMHNSHKEASKWYSAIALPVLAPIIIILFQTNFAYWYLMVGSLASFGIAMLFRLVDLDVPSKYGTHWLWHIFGIIASHLLIWFTFVVG